MSIDGRYLFLWRHGDAGIAQLEPELDFARELSARGLAQVAQASEWLNKRLPAQFNLLSSAAPRAWLTAQHLGEPTQLDQLRPGQSAPALERAMATWWPTNGAPTVLVGHQPQLGALASLLIGGQPGNVVTIRKAAIWCLKYRSDKQPAVIVTAVRDPGFES